MNGQEITLYFSNPALTLTQEYVLLDKSLTINCMKYHLLQSDEEQNTFCFRHIVP